MAVPAPSAIIITPSKIYANVLLLKERKNLGPAINPTAVTNKAVPMLETIPKFAFIVLLKR